jgi:hypothetical protein
MAKSRVQKTSSRQPRSSHFIELGARRDWWSQPHPGCFTYGKDMVPILQEAVWTPGRSGRVRKISPPPEFDPRTVQPVASRYTD